MALSPMHPRTWSNDGWFEIQQLTDRVYAFHEPGHYEEPISTLVMGDQQAALVDTGCGIGDLRRAVEAVTVLSITVINTHTHIDHLGSNPHFDAIAMYDHPLAQSVAAKGVSSAQRQHEILADHLVTRPMPVGVGAGDAALPPWRVDHWLRDGDRVHLGDRDLEVLHTPGESADHICLLDRVGRLLLSGDILLEGPIWTHLPGGSLTDLITSYRRLMKHYDEFDHLLPSHNGSWVDKRLLPEALAAAESVMEGTAVPEDMTDPWGTRLQRFTFDRFEIWTERSD